MIYLNDLLVLLLSAMVNSNTKSHMQKHSRQYATIPINRNASMKQLPKAPRKVCHKKNCYIIILLQRHSIAVENAETTTVLPGLFCTKIGAGTK